MALSYLLNIRSAFKVVVFSWIIASWPNAYGTPSSDTISRARCYANCITLSTVGSGGFHKENCETKTCQECLIPCKEPFTTERECQQKCSNSSGCEASCTFLHHLLNFSADGSTTSRPVAPTVNDTHFSSISLHWPPVSNANGTVVYLIGMTLAGDQTRSFPIYFSEVYTTTKATLTFNHLCRYIRSSPFRSTYNGISYRFSLAALTENSSISYGPQSEPISLQKPDPVSNVSVEGIQYSSASGGDKVMITFTWTPSENQRHIITKFAVVWADNCGQVTPRSKETSGPEARLAMPVYERLKKCSHTVEVYALINCTVSKSTKLIFEYPGCENVTDFPKNICYIFDPPKAPLEEKIVRNVTYGTMIVGDDYTFSTTLKWDPPAYPYKKVQHYVVRWGKSTAQGVQGVHITRDRLSVLENLLPGTTYLVKIRNLFEDGAPTSGETNFSFTTPAVAIDEVRVQNLTTGQFVLSPIAGRLTLDIGWLKPPFNYSELSSYKVSYQIGVNKQTTVNISETHFDIWGISHGEPVVFQVTPVYKHYWINGTVVERRLKAPVPQDEDLKVRDLMCLSFKEKEETGSFLAYISWSEPAFNFSLNAYRLEYELSGYPDKKYIKINVNDTGIMIAGVRPREILSFKVRPVFANDFISGLDSTCVKTAPDPDATLLIVQNLHFERAPEYTPMKFVYNVSWDKPTFTQSPVTGYRVLYRRKGNPERNKEYTSMKNENSFIARELIPGDILDVSVTPIFVASIITGQESTITIEAPGPTDEQNIVRNLTAETFIEDNENNTYAVNFTWESPSFQYSSVNHYNLFYEFSGYIQDHSPCRSSFRARAGCVLTGVKTNFIELSNIFPREGVSLEVTPVYENTYITGRMSKKTATAPEPREELVKVQGLKHGELMATRNKTFRTQVTWRKPQFQHSEVKHYKYKTFVVSGDPSKKKRRETGVSIEVITENTNVTIDGLTLDQDISFEVTPVFVESVVSGRIATISLSRKPVPGNEPLLSRVLSPAEIGGVVVGLLLLFVILIGLTIWCHRERQRQMKAKGLVSGKNALMIDQWEVDGDLVSLEEELGEGAFGKVFKGFLRELPQPSRKLSLMPPIASARKSTIKTPEGFTVAVKMLHGMADNEQRREFLDEIQLMKAVGSHKNIVNMIGCCTVEEPMFLLVEYIPYGDLLHYLRKRRGKVKEYLGDESRGPYRSTYWETYVIDGCDLGRTTVQMRRNDREYANTPVTSKGDYGNIQLLSFNNSKPHGEIGTDNNVFAKNEAWEDDEEETAETLTPGDLMAFAWQISQGMEYLARKGFVHRDLAARNVLVGDHKIAKVADFGLTRHVYEEKVYHAKRNRKLPLKWMSIEAIFDQTFTSQSDVWAFGVVLWELVTLGGTPYPTINNRELLRLLRGGYRMEKPDICNDEIYELMTKCWREIPDERPSFTAIRERLEEMMQKDNPYLDFSVLDESREYYNVPSFNSLQGESGEDDVFEEDSEELIKESSDGTLAEERSLSEDPNGNSKLSFNSDGLDKGRKRAGSVDLGAIDLKHNSYRGMEFDDLSNVKINVDELEMSLYRSRSRGLVL